MRINRLLRHGLHLSVTGDITPPGGGQPVTPPVAPVVPPPLPPAAPDTSRELAELRAKLAQYEGKDQQARDAGLAKEREESAAALRTAQEEAAKHASRAKTALLRAALSDLAKPDYVRMAPEVVVGDDGDLTKESKEALAKFRKENANLFQAPHVGFTPQSAAGAGSGDDLAPEERAMLARMGINPKANAERLAKSPIAQFVGWNGGAKK